MVIEAFKICSIIALLLTSFAALSLTFFDDI